MSIALSTWASRLLAENQLFLDFLGLKRIDMGLTETSKKL
jgi:hypothetical protein